VNKNYKLPDYPQIYIYSLAINLCPQLLITLGLAISDLEAENYAAKLFYD
jgi:hypothetical protein